MPTDPPPDPYTVLGISPDATPLQVARAHRRLAKRFHPDLHPDEATVERMREVNEAYRRLRSADPGIAADAAPARAPAASHWAPSRRPVRPAEASTTRSWAAWRASAAETRATPGTRRSPGEVHEPVTRRPGRLEPVERRFSQSGWAALLMAAAFLVVMAAAMVAGRLAALP
ncbi:MAG TPA: J domain-containing protein [Candidatus Limnocylindria bacterium]|nr:J domain-containing protein [Candidatus Limnocylindria bacterium]